MPPQSNPSEPHRPDSIENSEQIALYRTLNRAMLAQDVATLDRILSDDFTLTHITGYTQSRQEWLDHIRTGKMRYMQIDEVSVNTNGTKLIGRATTTADIWGVKGTWNLQLAIDLEQQGNQWRMKKAIATLF